jgi:hypothetical protein
MTDDLTPLLAQIRERSELASKFYIGEALYRDSAADVPRLLAAIGAVRELADEWEQRPGALGLDRAHVAAQVREAIRTALAAERAAAVVGDHRRTERGSNG